MSYKVLEDLFAEVIDGERKLSIAHPSDGHLTLNQLHINCVVGISADIRD